MLRYHRCFSNRHVVLPVIHIVDERQTLQNAELALEAGADGVFLINHDLAYKILLEIHNALVAEFPDLWSGVNCLDLEATDVFDHIDGRINGVWTDNALIDETKIHQPNAADVSKKRQNAGWNGLYFGGVAFKYQREVTDLATAASIAADYMDVVTTSGPATGQAAAPDKIRIMKQAIGDVPLAIASGITPENVIEYLPYADCFLVATGISRRIDFLDADLTRSLIYNIRNYDDKITTRS